MENNLDTKSPEGGGGIRLYIYPVHLVYIVKQNIGFDGRDTSSHHGRWWRRGALPGVAQLIKNFLPQHSATDHS